MRMREVCSPRKITRVLSPEEGTQDKPSQQQALSLPCTCLQLIQHSLRFCLKDFPLWGGRRLCHDTLLSVPPPPPAGLRLEWRLLSENPPQSPGRVVGLVRASSSSAKVAGSIPDQGDMRIDQSMHQ